MEAIYRGATLRMPPVRPNSDGLTGYTDTIGKNEILSYLCTTHPQIDNERLNPIGA